MKIVRSSSSYILIYYIICPSPFHKLKNEAYKELRKRLRIATLIYLYISFYSLSLVSINVCVNHHSSVPLFFNKLRE